MVYAFDNADVIDWKQGAGIKKNDTVFLDSCASVSAILYRCKVTEVDIPYGYHSSEITITGLMKIKLIKRYKPVFRERCETCGMQMCCNGCSNCVKCE